MRAELIVDNHVKGRFDFAVAPRVGDCVLFKDESATVSEFRHNLDQNRLQVLCTAPKQPQSAQIRRTVSAPPLKQEAEKDK